MHLAWTDVPSTQEQRDLYNSPRNCSYSGCTYMYTMWHISLYVSISACFLAVQRPSRLFQHTSFCLLSCSVQFNTERSSPKSISVTATGSCLNVVTDTSVNIPSEKPGATFNKSKHKDDMQMPLHFKLEQ